MRFRCAPASVLWFAIAGVQSGNAFAQAPQFVFTATAPEPTRSETILQTSVVVEDRGLGLWGGDKSDFGIGIALSGPRWTVRSITSMTTLPLGSNGRPAFQQLEIVRPLLSTGSTSVAGGGGIRQEWDGTRVIVGRVLAGSDVGRGRLQGGVVLERALSSPARRDAADVVTSLGWSRRIGARISVGVESIGQDLEGLWNPSEADGGAKLLVGPSLHAQSKGGDWAASFTAGPVLHAPAAASPPALAATYPDAGRHFGIFASANWMPSLRH